MKNKLFFVALFATGALAAQNLIHDPDFDKGNFAECRFDYTPGSLKNRIITEDGTKNKCLRIENVRHIVDAKTGKKSSLIICWIGKDGNGPGFKVEPNTVYEFQFQLKGTYAPKVSYSEWKGTNFWKDMKTGKVDLTDKPVVSKEWKTVKGSFKTSATAKTAALHLEMSGQERWNTLVPVGAYFMIDKVQVQKKK